MLSSRRGPSDEEMHAAKERLYDLDARHTRRQEGLAGALEVWKEYEDERKQPLWRHALERWRMKGRQARPRHDAQSRDTRRIFMPISLSLSAAVFTPP